MKTETKDYCDGILKESFNLRDVLTEVKLYHAENFMVHNLNCDSRKVQKGELFVCMTGTKSDGHLYAAEAISKGAAALVVEKYLPEFHVPQCVVPNSRLAYGHLCQSLFGYPAKKLKIAGITGTNGKTTTVYLIKQMLEMCKIHCGMLGTVQYSDGVEIQDASMTTPDAYQLALWMKKMAMNNTNHLAMEVSSHALSQHRLSGISLSAGIITNITHDHLDYHQSYNEYQHVKSSLQNMIRADGTFVLNVDDPGISNLVEKKIIERDSICYGTVNNSSSDSAYQITQIQCGLELTAFHLRHQGRNYCFEIQLPGIHNVQNFVGAIIVLHQWGIDLDEIQHICHSLQPAPGRLESINCGQPFHVFIDYAHTPDAIEKILQTLRPFTRNRLICILGAGGDRDRTKRPFMGKAGSKADILIITSDNPRSENPETIAKDIQNGTTGETCETLTILDRKEAIAQACKIGQLGDIVVIAGKGHESTQTIGDTVLDFNDKTVVTELLQNNSTFYHNYSNSKIPA